MLRTIPGMGAAAALAATIAVAVPARAAEEAAGGPMTPLTAPHSVTTTRLAPGQIRGTEIKGAEVFDAHDRKLGTVKDMILGGGGRLAQIVLDVDGKSVALDLAELTIATDEKNKPRISVDATKDQFTAAPAQGNR